MIEKVCKLDNKYSFTAIIRVTNLQRVGKRNKHIPEVTMVINCAWRCIHRMIHTFRGHEEFDAWVAPLIGHANDSIILVPVR
jgi:hypothetical protein